jgi:anthranilate/para-aminobenzoate synthase component I
MTPLTQQLDLSPDVLGLARRLAPGRGLVVLWSADGSGPSYVACQPIETSLQLDPEPTLGIGVAPNPSAPPQAWSFPRWIGVLPYEAFRDVERPGRAVRADPRVAPPHQHPIWFRYGAVLRVDHEVTVLGETRAAVDDLVKRLTVPSRPVGSLQLRRLDSVADEAHAQRIIRAQQLILDGDLYLVNLARRLSFAVQGDEIELLRRMAEQSRPPFGAYLDLGETRVCSTSPELFLKLSADRSLLTSPIKGTRPRDRDATKDQALAQQLASDAKEQAELAMVIDVERNDLGRVAEVGSVRLSGAPRVVPCGGVWHRVADVTARLDPRQDRQALLKAMAPSGSVTGAPKVRAMEVIAELEAARRGLYTGAIGYLAHDGGLLLSMAIRTLVLHGAGASTETEASYFSGGGIVLDSDPQLELEETEWKARQLLALCGAVP